MCVLLQDLLQFTDTIRQLQADDSWRGVNHDSVFQPMYQMLLALHCAATCCLSTTEALPTLLAHVQQAAQGLSQVALHPVLAAMLDSTVAVLECSASNHRREVSPVLASIAC